MKAKIYKGDVEIRISNQKEWEKKLKGVTKITGNIYVSQGVSLTIPSMALTQTGYIDVREGASLTIPSMALTQTGYIDVREGASLTIPSMALTQTGNIYVSQGVSLTIPSMALTQTGNIYVREGVSLTIPSMALTQTGNIYVRSNKCEELVKYLLDNFKLNKWYINENTPQEIIDAGLKNAIYILNDVRLKREWFIKIKYDKLSVEEVFAIDNIEHRRIAYQFMDKMKMKNLPDYKVLDEIENDGYGFPMRIVSFTIQNMKEALLFYNCHCPSTGREYFIGTNFKTCESAKLGSFGLNEGEFVKEW